MVRELVRYVLVQQLPIGPSPTVNALLHIPHYQVLAALGVAVVEKRTEIGPLHLGRILKLIKKEMVEPHSKLLIHERSIGPVYDIAQDSV